MKALIIVDVQNDFCEGGALEVKDGSKIIPLINEMAKDYPIVVATRDFHPLNHKSFASNNEGAKIGELKSLNNLPQVMWPNHCVQGSKGSEFHKELDFKRVNRVFKKGLNPEIDSYSGFYDNDHIQSTGLFDYLKKNHVTEVMVVGLALDYCVKFTALDAKELGFKTSVNVSATKAVNLNPGDDQKAILELKEKCVTIEE